MKILATQQPWASAAVLGGLEVLSVAHRTNFRGLVGVVASTADPHIVAGGERARRELASIDVGLRGQELAGVPWSLLGCVMVTHCSSVAECDLPFASGPWCWRIVDPLVLWEPVPWPEISDRLQAASSADEILRSAIPPAEWQRRKAERLSLADLGRSSADGWTGD